MSKNFEYIIVGGGASGSALASVLAKKGTTLLIEKGANHTFFPQSKVNEGWPQIAVLAIDGLKNMGSGHWTGTPNILGGGSAMNGAACLRGQKGIFTALGIDIQTAERAFEHIEDRICLPVERKELHNAIAKGWGENTDFKRLEGYGYSSWIAEALKDSSLVAWTEERDAGQYNKTIQFVRTIAAAKDKKERRPASFLFEKSFVNDEPSILDQGNLTVYLLTQAKKIIFNDDKEAVGVDVISPSGNFTAYVRRGGKVFLNAGAYETPKLLMLSGIGPEETLSSFDIPIIHANEKVGKNLIDRKATYFGLPAFKDLEEGDAPVLVDMVAISEDTWQLFTHKNSPEWGGAFQRCGTCKPVDRTESCFEQMAGALMFYGSGIRQSPYTLPFSVNQRFPGTRGNITLASSNYEDSPLVHDGWSMTMEELSDAASKDLDILVEGVREHIIDMVKNTTLLKQLGLNNVTTGNFSAELQNFINSNEKDIEDASIQLDQCKFASGPINDCSSWDECIPTVPLRLPINNDKALREIVFNSMASDWHMAGTCKVGEVVKKSTMEVIGVKNLYVSDLSVIAEAVDTHPMMTAISLGIIFGNNTEPVPIGDFEMFPVVVSATCCALILAMPLIFLVHAFWKKVKGSRNSADYRSLKQTMAKSARSLRALSTSQTTIMEWRDVSCTYETKSKKVTTLFNNKGRITSGELTALMGPSGASKSTLLDILAGRKSQGIISGRFKVLGQNIDASVDGVLKITTAMKSHGAYIPQQEFFYPTQTCFEAVKFVANMRLGKPKDEAERDAFISLCLDEVGLPSVEFGDRKIGGDLPGGVSIRGLSGGERKRLVLATALALKPRVMFIDEITSGLDSENSLVVMELLKKLSREKNVASVVIIHQPSAKVFKLFDNLFLLAKGRPVFAGSLDDLTEFYERNHDEALPADSDLADDLILKATSFASTANEDHWSGTFGSEHTTAVEDDCEVKGDDMKAENKELEAYAQPPALWKLVTVFNRNLKNQYISNVANVVGRLASYGLLSVLIGGIFFHVGNGSKDRDADSVFNGLTFEEAGLVVRTDIFILNVSYLLPFSTIPIFVGDKRFFVAESALGLYSAWMYGLSQVILETVFVTVASTLQTCIIVPMCAMANPTFSASISFMTMLSSLILSGLVGSTLVFLCSIALPSQDLAFLAGSTVVTISLAISGGFLPFSEMVPFAYSIQWLSPVKYSMQALLTSQFVGTSAEKLLDIGEYNTPASISANLGILIGIFLLLALLSGLAMSRLREVR